MTEHDDVSRLAVKFALINALEHSGRADIGSVIGRILAENVDLRREAQLVRRITSSAVQEVNQLDVDKQRRKLQEEFPGELEKHITRKKTTSRNESEKEFSLPELEGAVQGEFVSRFPPEPNGFMHIGHAKAAIIGYEYAKKYGGKFIVRFDDTNPAAESKEYYVAFLESLSWLGIIADKVKNASDDIPIFYELAERMLKSSRGYVCTCSQEVIKIKRSAGETCSHRSQTVPENMALWNEMISGQRRKGSTTLRLVGNMASLNTTMRDPVLFRIVEEPHPLKNSQYHVWPTYDFDGAVEDSLDGVTHAFRSKEYELRDESYYAILDALDLRKPKIVEFSRLSLQNTTVSKRNLRKLIDEGLVSGWDDPRLPTIAGLKRRGFLPEAIMEFVLSMGVSKVESQPTWDLLESMNRKLLDPVAKRLFFVAEPVQLLVNNAPQKNVRLSNHPDKSLGVREIQTKGKFLISKGDADAFKAGSKIRLIEAYNVEVKSTGTVMVAEYAGEENDPGVKKVQWVTAEDNLPFSITITGPLLIHGSYNPDSLRRIQGAIESSALDLKIGESFQIVRFGFCRLDSKGVAILSHK